jgi:hypothetical protein
MLAPTRNTGQAIRITLGDILELKRLLIVSPEPANARREHGADKTRVNKYGSTPLKTAEQFGHSENVKILSED